MTFRFQVPPQPQAREGEFEAEVVQERLLDNAPAVVDLRNPESDFEVFQPSVENFRSSGDRTRTPIRFDTERLPKSGKNIAFRPL